MKGLPINFLTVLQRFHDVADPNRLVPDHDAEFFSHLVLFMMDSEGFVLEDSLVIFFSQEDKRPYVVVGVLADIFQNGWVLESNHILGADLGESLVALYFFLLVETQTVQTSQVGRHQLFANTWRPYFCEIFLEELNLDGLLNLRKS